MASLSDARTLGGIGSLLVLFTPVPNVGWILGIAGLVMILAAVRNISEVVGDKEICHDMRTAVVLAVGAIAVGTVTVIGAVYQVLGMGTFSGSKFVLASNITTGDWFGLAVVVAVGVLVVEGFLVASAVFVRKSLKIVSSKLNIKRFETAGLLYLIAAASAIVVVGFILLFVAEILLAISFFSISEQQNSPQLNQVQPIAATS